MCIAHAGFDAINACGIRCICKAIACIKSATIHFLTVDINIKSIAQWRSTADSVNCPGDAVAQLDPFCICSNIANCKRSRGNSNRGAFLTNTGSMCIGHLCHHSISAGNVERIGICIRAGRHAHAL